MVLKRKEFSSLYFRLRGGKAGRSALAEVWAKKEQLGVHSPYFQAAMMHAQHHGSDQEDSQEQLNKVQQMLFDCHVTFGNPTAPITVSDLEAVKRSVSALTAADLGTKESEIDRRTIQYTDVYDGDDFTVCMFQLPAGCRLPMHDHPDMHVLSKVLFGRLEVTAYDRLEPKPSPILPGPLQALSVVPSKPFEVKIVRNSEVWTPEDEAQITAPDCGNIHQFVAITDCCVLDVLAPPYDFGQSRRCTYYEIHEKDGKLYATPTQCPSDYVTKSVKYSGLPIDS